MQNLINIASKAWEDVKNETIRRAFELTGTFG